MRWMDLMRGGDFTSAWALSDSLLGAPQDLEATPRHLQRIWSGEPLSGRRVLVRCYHGLGDTIQFIRYAPVIRHTAREVIVWTQPALLPTLRTMSGIDRLLPLHDGRVRVEYDVDVEVMELPHVCRTTLETIPRSVPYLHAATTSQRRERMRVGFMWRSGDWEPARSIPFESMSTLLAVRGIHAVPLDTTVSQTQARRFASRPDVTTIEALAATLRSLDLVVTVDTMVAHLAGAMAVRTWLLLHSDPDWRWMNDRADSPWYPQMTIYRQSQPGCWDPVIARVRGDLVRIVHRSSPDREDVRI